MKRYLIPVLVLLVLASGLLIGCGQGARPIPTPTIDLPSLRSDEVCALVYNYLERQVTAMTIGLDRRQLLATQLGQQRPYFTASYQGNGKWQVLALGNDGAGAHGQLLLPASGGCDGLWNVYENSG